MIFVKKILIIGGVGFIGFYLVQYFVKKYFIYQIVNLDKLIYVGNLVNLKEIENVFNYIFVKGDIMDEFFIQELFSIY